MIDYPTEHVTKMPGTVSLPGTGKFPNLRPAGAHRTITEITPAHRCFNSRRYRHLNEKFHLRSDSMFGFT